MLSPVEHYLRDLHAACAQDGSGELAAYIPELALADPDWFGICLATADGRVYEVGDTRQPFTIQSMSKPFVYGLALHDNGRERLAEKVGVEPSGDAFNEISLHPETGRPLNPMINAGAITSTSLVHGATPHDRFARLLGTLSAYAGRPLTVDEDVFGSERATGHRNRAIGHMLRTFDILTEDPEATLDAYFRQCSVQVTCRDMSLMAATLANRGVQPITGRRVLEDELTQAVLSVMTTCGLYDAAGHWLDWVGMPAKSGVSGGILAVLPGQLGVCVFSPRLDRVGNSVRGMEACRRLSRDLRLHFLHVPRSAGSAVRASHDVRSVPSRRRRSEHERRVLEDAGGRARVYVLQGDLVFGGTERVIRSIVDRSDDLDAAVLDLRAVTTLGEPAARLLMDLRGRLAAEEKELVFVETGAHDALWRVDGRPRVFGSLDAATEWCEERLLSRNGGAAHAGGVELHEHALCRGLKEEQLTALAAELEARDAQPGATIIRAGAPADVLYLLMAGEVSVTIPAEDGSARRLATLQPGMIFGEAAVLGRAKRTADVTADAPSRLLTLSAATFEDLGRTDPALQAALLHNLLRGAYETVDRLTREVATLSRGR